MLKYLKLSFDMLAGLLIVITLLVVEGIKRIVTNVDTQRKIFATITVVWIIWWLVSYLFIVSDFKELHR